MGIRSKIKDRLKSRLGIVSADPPRPASNYAPSGSEPADRPAASGHRFGPDLACSECGIQWDAHQRSPAPCDKEAQADAFLRRPPLER